MDLTSTLGVGGVLVEEDCTTCVMGHVEVIRETLVVNVVRRLESPLHNRTGRKVFTGTVHVGRCSMFPFSDPSRNSAENGSTRRSGKGLS